MIDQGPDEVRNEQDETVRMTHASMRARTDQLIRELRVIAGFAFAGERSGHTLQPTAIVSEAWLRLMESPESEFPTMAAFRGWAARVVRNVLVDHARARNALKRGGGAARQIGDVEDVLEDLMPREVERLHDALEELRVTQPRMERIVELRFFGGMTEREIATELKICERTVRADWALARAWLRQRLAPAPG